jgi:ATP-dependent DNA helicase RecG
MLVAVESGYQALLMVPTELLAEQHQRSLDRFLEATAHNTWLLTASMPAAERRASLEAMESGQARIVVGTHALLQEKVDFHRLGLVVVDEQHRFGVMQRARIREKGWNPDVLVMTATPIPRSLALTVYGELDVSVIDELPPGRRKIATAVRDDKGRAKVYSFLREEMDAGRQAYVVYPLVEETEESDLKAATQAAARLRKRFAPHSVGLVHGRIKKEEREETMRAFREGEIQLLVATTVIEVGVDVENATVMLVEHAERFGLSQLHQLRGRVGRGAQRSWCILMRGRRATPEAERRLEAMVETTDGFRIAERDLEIRGPGEFFGTRQSGLPPLRAANIIRDRRLLELARDEAFRLAEAGFPAGLKRYLLEIWGERFGLVEVG